MTSGTRNEGLGAGSGAGTDTSLASNDPQQQRQLAAEQIALRSNLQKLAQLELDADEHQRVLETLKPLAEKNPNRRGHRLVGDILIEKPISEIIPDLEENYSGITKAVEDFKEGIKKQEQKISALSQTIKGATKQSSTASSAA